MTTEVSEIKGSNKTPLCPLRFTKHKILRCSPYMTKSAAERRKLVKEKKLCFNCLNSDHMVRTCPSQYSCRESPKRQQNSLHEHNEQNRAISQKKKNSSTHLDLVIVKLVFHQSKERFSQLEMAQAIQKLLV